MEKELLKELMQQTGLGKTKAIEQAVTYYVNSKKKEVSSR